jgi:hypothetical protein
MLDPNVNELFAVSKNGSVFHIHVSGNEAVLNRLVSVDGLFWSQVPLSGGRYVGITADYGATKYSASIIDGKPICACKTNTGYWGGGTSSLVALFPHLKTAVECARSEDLQSWDKRWIEITRYMINAIGRDHPLIIICDEVPRIVE